MWFFIGATYCAYLAYTASRVAFSAGVSSVAGVHGNVSYIYVYFTSFITDLSHKVIDLLTFCLSGERTLERKVAVLSKAAPFGCEIGRLPIHARFVASVRHDDCGAWRDSCGKHLLRIDVAQSAVILVAPVIPRSAAVKDVSLDIESAITE